MILDGRIVADTILQNIKDQITYSPSTQKPMLAVVLVGDNPASLTYIKMKEKKAREVGMRFGLYHFPATISQEDLEFEVRRLSNNDQVHGIIVQSPLPEHINAFAITECIDPRKDVDGFTRTQVGNMFLGHDGLWSCTPKGIMTLLSHYNIPVAGKKVAVIGRSNIVGKPMALMLINAGATVTSCNSKTPSLSSITRSANIIIIATGKPNLLTRDMVNEHSVVIDVGCTFLEGKACGDAHHEDLRDFVHAISPVPGGVGPMTVATLIENTWKAFIEQTQGSDAI